MKKTLSGMMVLAAIIAAGVFAAAHLAQPAAAQNAAAGDPPLTIANNFLVTGDFVVAGAYGMNSHIQGGVATGTITIPDTNPGITGVKQVPAGAQIVAALLYWETAEKVGVTPGGPGSGQNGFFRPLFTKNNVNLGPAAPGYAISGTSLMSHNTVAFSNGGCSGGSTGKVVRVYRADVRGFLPEDGNGNVIVNGTDPKTGITYGQYEIRLPSSGSTTPITLGATLVIVYRVISSTAPLNAIVIYDGAFAPSSTTTLTMNQPIEGFYDAAPSPSWRLAQLVGSGASNKFQTAYLNNVPLPNLYASGQPFPGWYGNWDNTTWTSSLLGAGIQSALPGDASSTSAQVIPRTNNAGCVSWGATIFSTTVNDFNFDGILKSWKLNGGYTDVLTGQHVNLPDASINQQDVYVQLDHIVDQDTNTSFDANPAALTMVQNALLAHNIHLHITHGNPLMPGSDAIPQKGCVDSVDAKGNPLLCPYPNQLVTTFRAGFDFLKNQPLNYPDEASCQAAANGPCIRQFAPAQKDSYRYGIFGDFLGAPDWTLQDGTLVSVVATNSTTVTFTTSTPHGLVADAFCANDAISNGRVTVVDAISNPSLNGTYCVTSVSTSAANQAPDIFTIKVAKATNATHFTDPNLGVASGKAGKRSATSDRGGSGMLVSLGSWGLDGQKVTTQAGTITHEIGHWFGLGHGGAYRDDPNNPFVLTDEPNCKSNYQSVMNYRFQVDLMDKLINNQIVGGFLDLSREELVPKQGQPPLNEGGLSGVTALKTTVGADPFYFTTRWYAPATPSQVLSTDYAKRTCDGAPVPANGPHLFIHDGPATAISWTDPLNSNLIFTWLNGQDIDFNNIQDAKLRGFNDWANLDLRQIGATASAYVINGGFPLGGGGFPLGGGGFPLGGGGFPLGGGGFPLGGGGFPLGGGASAGDISFETANSVTRPPRNLTAAEEASARVIDLSWTAPTFGQIVKYKVYRSDAGAAFHFIGMVTGTPPVTTFPDSPACNLGGYRYEVTAVIFNPDTNLEQESVPSNIASTGQSGDPLTACYGPAGFNLSSPTSAVQGSIVPITWTLQDASNTNGDAVNRAAANTLVATGPLPNSCTTVGPTTLILNGVVQGGAGTFPAASGGNFTFNWDTDTFCAGPYTFKLTLDSGQSQTTATPLQLSIDVTDSDSTPHITTRSVPDGTVGVSYSYPIIQDGGVGTITWSLASGSLPAGIVLNTATGTLSGTATVPAPGVLNFTSQVSNFTVKATDSVGNTGTQGLTLRLITAVSLSRTDNPIGTGPIGLISADFNGDGKRDLASANSGNNTVSVLLGNGDGSFTAQPTLATGSVPYSLAAGDFDGDGKLDLAVANFANGVPSTVSVFLGNGDGTFQAGVTYAVGSGPISVVTGDFNGDGKLDLAVANQNDHSVSILLGNGDGTFQAHVDYAAGTTDVAAAAVGDFNGDGKPDLALSNPSSDTVSVLLGNGDGTFGAPVPYATGNSGDHPIAVSAVDLNGDGKIDLAVTNLNAKTVAIFLGNGDGTFQTEVSYPTTTGAFIGPSAMVTGDFNGDSKIDLAITDQHDNSVSILLGNGNGTFQSPLEFSTGNLAGGVASGDFNGDGRLDLGVANSTDNTVSIMLQRPQPARNLAVSSVTAGQVGLAWTSSLSSGIAGYNVYRATTSGGPYTKINAAVVVAPSFTDLGVAPGTYYYVVTAVGPNSLESILSNEVSATAP